jgi:hypothetical protein
VNEFYKIDKNHCRSGRRNPCIPCITKYNRKLYMKYLTRYRKSDAEYRKRNREKLRIAMRQWRTKNADRSFFIIYKSRAKESKREFLLTFEQFILLRKRPCFYCDTENKPRGLDRVNNKKGYVIENVVPCCEICNRMKMTLSKGGFIRQCSLIVKKHGAL